MCYYSYIAGNQAGVELEKTMNMTRSLGLFGLYALAMAALAATSFGATKSVPATYIVNGKIVTNVEALLSASKGESVMKCTIVELKPSKSGTSFSLRTKKVNE